MGSNSTDEKKMMSSYFGTNLPFRWTEKRLCHLAKQESAAFVDGPFGSDLKTTDYKSDGVPLIQLNNIRDGLHRLSNMKYIDAEKKAQLKRHIAVPGDIVIAKMAEPVARAAAVNSDFDEYVIVADCVKMSPELKLVNLEFLVWAINCDFVRINAELVSTGTTRIRISLGELKKLKIPYPTVPEQVSIAEFLNYETAKIDELIEKQQKLIELLKEKRQAVISHAVTKGLNPDAPMKDSGVEWLGEVPEHWGVCSLKHYAKVVDCKHITAEFFDEGIPLASITEVKGRYVNLDTAKFTNEKYYLELIEGGREPKAGDIIYSRNATVGEAALVPKNSQKFAMGQDVCLIRLSQKFLPEFVHSALRSKIIFQQLDLAMVGSTFKRINVDDIRKFKISMPPFEEQMEIVKELNRLTDKFDLLERAAQFTIELMQERRTALISAAVTGKIDVRDWQPPKQTSTQRATRTTEEVRA